MCAIGTWVQGRERGAVIYWRLFAGPSRVAAGLLQLVFHIGELLLKLGNLLLFRVNFGLRIVDVLAGVLLLHGFLRVGIILNLGLLQFALQHVEFCLRLGDLCPLIGEALAPIIARMLGITQTRAA